MTGLSPRGNAGGHLRRSAGLLLCQALAVVAGALTLLPTLADAGTSRRDVATTRTYLQARIGELRASDALLPAELRAYETLASQLKHECPGVLAGGVLTRKQEEPLSQSALDIAQELLMGVLGVGEHVEHRVLERFLHQVKRLRWSDWSLTHLIHSFALEQALQSGLPSPKFCVDMEAWVASGYTTVPAGTKRFLRERSAVASITRIESGPGEPLTLDVDETIAHRLMPYEDEAGRRLARKLPKRKPKLTDPSVRRWLEAVNLVFLALERPAPASG